MADITAAMLEQGTLRNDRFTIAEQLEYRCFNGKFKTDAHALNFSGRFLRQDAGVVMSLLAEQLREPAFSEDMLTAQKQKAKAGLLQAMESTDYLADARISRMLYPEGHPNYQPALESLIASLESITVEDLKTFHSEHYGPESMRLVFAGDIRFDQLTAAVENAFSDWSGGKRLSGKHDRTLPGQQKKKTDHTC